MIWPTNANKLAAATMYTLFFGGNRFAPATRIEREPVQESQGSEGVTKTNTAKIVIQIQRPGTE